MFSVARRLLRSDNNAQDAVQEAFLSAFKAISWLDGTSSLPTWLHQIVVNAAVIALRSPPAARAGDGTAGQAAADV